MFAHFRSKLCLRVFLVVWFAFGVDGCSKNSSQGPSDAQIEQDVRATMVACKFSSGTKLVLDKVQVTAKSAEQMQARIIVKMQYHYDQKRGPLDVWLGPPCSLFNRPGDNGEVEGQITYRKYDTGWRME
jgi:hypothetical protein